MSGDQLFVDAVLVDLPTVSNLALGSGPSGLEPGATPGNLALSTLPAPPPHEEVAVLEGKNVCEVGVQTISSCINTFSSKTCLELLSSNKLSQDQIQFEANYLRPLCNDVSVSILSDPDMKTVVNEIKSQLSNTLCFEFEATTKNHDLTLSNFSRLVDEAQKHVDKLVELNAAAQVWSPDTAAPPELDCTVEEELPDTVCSIISDIDFSDIDISDVLRQLSVNQRGTCGRSTAYFGSRPYSYGRVNHEKREFPDCPVMNSILDKMKSVDPHFNTSDYTCLVTYYPDGRSYIPAHSDNEHVIKGGTNIYTVSVGATRTLKLVNRTGPLREYEVPLSNGSVYSMSADSQADWSHELLFDNDIKQGRVSFTFRYMTDPPAKPTAPIIERPPPVQPRMAMGHKKRILFITDSVLNSTPENIFTQVKDHVCVKKKNYYLTDLFNFEPEFKYSRTVMISLGLNDLSTRKDGRAPFTGSALADWVERRLGKACRDNPGTTFVFNSVLHTTHDWLNAEVDVFNRAMSELSGFVRNLEFLDTHSVLMRDEISRRLGQVLDLSDSRGTHLTLRAKKIITHNLVTACEYLDGRRQGKYAGRRVGFWIWPIRTDFLSFRTRDPI